MVQAPGLDLAVPAVVRTFALLAGMTLVACPPGSGGGAGSSEPVTTCTRVGQSCLFAPGKLGLCVERTAPCEGNDCLVCQSQH
jgi:hypothetical protein